MASNKTIYGPEIPKEFLNHETSEPEHLDIDKDTELKQGTENEPTDDQNCYGPALPPHLQKPKESKPPTPPETQTEVDDDDVIGPSLPGSKDSVSQQLEIRALEIKLRGQSGNNDNKTASREEWMLELPKSKELKQSLGPRQFSKSNSDKPSGTNLWTDTPTSKTEPKPKDLIEQQRKYNQDKVEIERTRKQEEIVKKHEKKHKRDKSLLEIHQEKSKKKKIEEKKERRPFDREIDLKISRMDERQKQSVIDKAKFLDSRFAAGKSKYL